MAAQADSSSASATHENSEMNARKFQTAGKHRTSGKFQTPSSKLQGSSKHQAGCDRILDFGSWDFSRVWSLVLGAFCLLSFSAPASQPSISLSGLPLSFEPQEAMVGDSVAYFARGQNYQFAITATGAQIVLSKTDSEHNQLSGHASRITHHAPRTVQMHLLGANAYAPIHADGLLSGKMNYLLGNDPSQWRTDLPLYSKVQVDDVYPGINLIYYGNQDQLEYDFVVAPRARPEYIALQFEGADKIEINKDGELVLSFEGNEIRFHRPDIYQEVNGVSRPISGGYQFENSRTVSFSVGNYDHDLPLIIDPILAYSGYFGGNFGDVALGVKVDSSGFIYIAGETLSRKWPFPLVGNDTNFNGGRFNGDGFVAKLSNDASNLVYFTYIGGSEDDSILDLALDSLGNPYITGSTDSTNFPTLNAAFPKIRGFRDPTFHTIPSDAFVAELNTTNGGLVYSTYLGGSGADVAGAITVDANGNAYVTGYTYSTDFPETRSVLDTNIITGFTNTLSGSNDIFVAKISAGGTNLLYSTLFGGSGLDQGEGIAVDDSGHVYVCGFTGSTNFVRTPNALPGTNGLGIREINGMTNAVQLYRGVRRIPFDAFLARFDTTVFGTNSLEYSTLFGGKYNDAAFRMVLYSNTDVILTGNSRSPDFPTNNFPAPHKTAASAGNADAMLVRFSFAANSVVTNPPGIFYSTLFGGASEDVGWGLALDPSGNVYVVGITSSGDFPGTNGLTANGAPFLRTNHIALRDVFVTAFSNDASAILYSVMMGGKNEDFGYGIDVDSSGNAYVVGRTVSGNFPFTNASSLFVSKRNGTNDAFLAKILAQSPPAPPPPMLKSKIVGTAGIQLAWPHSASGYVLESNTDLANPAGWVPVTGFPLTTNNGVLQVQVPMTNGSLFFRLRR
jgi:hypothetical protein